MTVASYGMVLCGNNDDMHHRYRGKIEKVKFGVPINEAFAHDIPATLLVLLLKVNKEGPAKKDIWRAPGNQAQVRKLSQIMQHGRLVNISNFSVYTAASVIKKFLSKLPGGIFGRDHEETLFNSAANGADVEKQRQVFYRIFCSLPVPSQHLLVLLFGTFRIVTDTSDGRASSMNPNAIAISVAPSIFHSCIHDGRQARVEDLQRFKLASQIVCTIITSFGDTNLFPRECYEFYARITGRTLRVDENWTFSFQYPSISGCFSNQENSEYENNAPSSSSTGGGAAPPGTKYKKAPPIRNKAKSMDPDAARGGYPARISNRLSSSVGEVLLEASDTEECELEPVRPLTACAGDNSLSYLHIVHTNQARRMKSRSEWFLCPSPTPPPTDCRNEPTRSATTPERMIDSSQLFEPLTKDTTRAGQRAPLQERSESSFGQSKQLNSENNVPNTGSSVGDRRRSWKAQMKAFAHPSHSLDCADVDDHGSPKLRCHAASVEADTWLTDVASFHQVVQPKKRKSLKKKMSTQF